jgi:hypothetical protein
MSPAEPETVSLADDAGGTAILTLFERQRGLEVG